MTHTGEIRSEFSAPRIPFEEFVKRPAWQALPFLIQLALLHLRRAEQHPKPETDIETGRALSGSPMRPTSGGGAILPEQTFAPERDAR
jgi:hypothetical protein